MGKLIFCINCAQALPSKFPVRSSIYNISQRHLGTTQTLYKRQQRKYQPPVRPFWEYGATHRFLRGLDVEGKRYGPLVDRPDYTFLDGRPTPLTPEQAAERSKRIHLAKTVMKGMNKINDIKQYSQKRFPEIEEEKKNNKFPLKRKS